MHLLLPYFVVLIVILQYVLRKGTRNQKAKEQAFWDREAKANEVRRQDISKLNYITIPDNLPLVNSGNNTFDELVAEDGSLERALAIINSLRDKKILNLTGVSNTDLKLSYGVANLTELTQYDDNFTELTKAIAAVGHRLLEANDTEDALIFLEYGIEIGSDITSNYVDLGIIYASRDEQDGINRLMERSKELNSLSKTTIFNQLNDMLN